MSSPQLESMYQEIILDHYRHPHHSGLRDPFDAEVHHVNPTCGDEVTLRVKLSGDGAEQVVDDVSYESEGCSISQASASVLADLVIGKPVGEALATERAFTALMTSRGTGRAGRGRARRRASLSPEFRSTPPRVKCALLSWMAWKDALAQAGAYELQKEDSHG